VIDQNIIVQRIKESPTAFNLVCHLIQEAIFVKVFFRAEIYLDTAWRLTYSHRSGEIWAQVVGIIEEGYDAEESINNGANKR
jgi:hypothetical protein